MTTTENMKKYLRYKNIPVKRLTDALGKSTGYLNSSKEFSMEVLRQIIDMYPDLNIRWLITGVGEMEETNDLKDYDIIVSLRRKHNR